MGEAQPVKGDMPRQEEKKEKPQPGRVVRIFDAVQQRVPLLGFPLAVGKKFGDDSAGNLAALIDALVKAKPASSKGVYLRKVAVSSTMGVGVRVDTQTIAA